MAGRAPERSITESPEETEALGARVAERLGPGDLVLVTGDLGAGKTTFVRGACRALGVTDPVTSPTFMIGQRYAGRLPVSHLDLYRLESLEHEDPALLEDYLRPDSVSFVEWPQAASGSAALGRVTARVEIRHGGGDRREIEIGYG